MIFMGNLWNCVKVLSGGSPRIRKKSLLGFFLLQKGKKGPKMGRVEETFSLAAINSKI